jgi:hypothetical protein
MNDNNKFRNILNFNDNIFHVKVEFRVKEYFIILFHLKI